MVDLDGRAVEDVVARQQRLSGRDAGSGVELGLGGAWQGNPGGFIGSLGQARAVEARMPTIGSIDWRRVLISGVLYSSARSHAAGPCDGLVAAR